MITRAAYRYSLIQRLKAADAPLCQEAAALLQEMSHEIACLARSEQALTRKYLLAKVRALQAENRLRKNSSDVPAPDAGEVDRQSAGAATPAG